MRLRHIARKARLPIDRELFLSLFGGLEAGVSTTAAIVIGLVISERSEPIIITAALITVAVQAFNAATARYIGLRASEELDDLTETERMKPFMNALLQFLTHVLASVIPILPVLFLSGTFTIALSVFLAGVAMLLLIGVVQGVFLKVQARQNLIEILSGGLLVMAIGSAAGFGLKNT